ADLRAASPCARRTDAPRASPECAAFARRVVSSFGAAAEPLRWAAARQARRRAPAMTASPRLLAATVAPRASPARDRVYATRTTPLPQQRGERARPRSLGAGASSSDAVGDPSRSRRRPALFAPPRRLRAAPNAGGWRVSGCWDRALGLPRAAVALSGLLCFERSENGLCLAPRVVE